VNSAIFVLLSFADLAALQAVNHRRDLWIVPSEDFLPVGSTVFAATFTI
jgi:hypothetical protein